MARRSDLFSAHKSGAARKNTPVVPRTARRCEAGLYGPKFWPYCEVESRIPNREATPGYAPSFWPYSASSDAHGAESRNLTREPWNVDRWIALGILFSALAFFACAVDVRMHYLDHHEKQHRAKTIERREIRIPLENPPTTERE
jgi:hypothetical protein